MRWGTAVGPSAGALVLLGALGAPQAAGQPAANAVRVHSLSPGDTVYVLLDGGGHSLAVVDEDRGGVVLVDTKSAGWGRTIADAVSLVTELPVTTIINTHAHGDNAGGNGEVPSTTRINAHETAPAR
ncbi:MAG: MBL fold metallo-hydrolase, partial [Chloroflexi bacterium]|nr:MBL fold metallo-hydrolase [Chloroflexota bacterium]